MIMGKKLPCWTRDTRETSIDFDEQERIMTYSGLETCIHNSNSFENESGTSRGDGCITDSFDDDDSTCSSSTNAFGSFSSIWMTMKKEDTSRDEYNSSATSAEKEKQLGCTSHPPEVEAMREKFANLLLGEDITGGAKGISTALALSNAITNSAASVFGELWKLEPLPEERKRQWRREMDWLLSPTEHMVELVPAKQTGTKGRSMEIMVPRVRADVQMNLPALRKLDSMLIEALDSMVGTEFWYSEVGSRAEGRSRSAGESKRWWLPSPCVPRSGLSDMERKRLLHHGKLIYQVFKAVKAINESVLAEMPIPTTIKDILPKSGKAALGEELHRMLSSESMPAEEMINCLNLKSEHNVLETINKLDSAISVWKESITEQGNGKSPVRTSWSFMKDPISEMDKTRELVNQAEALLQQLRSKYPNLPPTFLEATKVQYGKDVGQAIIEAYSRVLANLAFSILSRIGDILQEDLMSSPNSSAAISHLVGARIPGISDSPVIDRVRHSLIYQKNCINQNSFTNSSETEASDVECHDEQTKIGLASATPSRNRVWCIGREASQSISCPNSP
ncbi:rop guanine nucleotide exchange factor 14-like isoform X2 [Andrographis paniculata]|nr:rop guanine nucleotide exchange factor 14-like isoform X2 [Andrographis paniculata]